MSKSRSMTKPDRLVTLVEKVLYQDHWFRDSARTTKQILLTLLRREQRAQRARVRNIIAQVKRQASQGRPYCYGIILDTCDAILAKMHGGTP